MPSATYPLDYISANEQKSSFLHIGDWTCDHLPAIHHSNYAGIFQQTQMEFFDVKETSVTPLYLHDFAFLDVAHATVEHCPQHICNEVVERDPSTQPIIFSWKHGPEMALQMEKFLEITPPLQIKHELASLTVENLEYTTVSSTIVLDTSQSSSLSTTNSDRSSQYSCGHTQSQYLRSDQDNTSFLETCSQLQAELDLYELVSWQDVPHQQG